MPHSTSSEQILEFATKRSIECMIERRALEIWLVTLKPANWITILMPALLSVLAGGTILSEPTLLGPNVKLFAGVCALAASLLTTVHKALDCDAHQAECDRLRRAFGALETEYDNIRVCQPEDLAAKIERANQRMEQLRESAAARPPDRYRRKAKREANSPIH